MYNSESVIDLQKCESKVLNNLPENMEVRGNLNLKYRKSLHFLPDGLKVGGWCNLVSTCVSILPERFKVLGDLEMDNCFFLKTLSKNLMIGGDFNLHSCDNLQSIPKGLKVGGILNLYYCLSLKKVSQDIQVGKKIEINYGEVDDYDNDVGTGISWGEFPERLSKIIDG